MDQGFTPEQQAMRETVRTFARRRLAPGYLERAQSDEFPRDIWNALADLGLFGITVPEADGGEGGDCVTAGIVMEELGYADPNAASFFLFATLAADLLLGAPSDALKEWGRRVRRGEAIVAGGVTESGAGSDLAGIRTKAVPVEGGWELTGEKSSISLAAAADAAFVLARTGPEPHEQGLFLVPLDQAGVSRQRFRDPGFRPAGRGSLAFEGVAVAEDMQIAAGGTGFQAMMREFDLSRTLLGLMCVGAAQASLDAAADYAKERVAFGRPIAKFQGVAFPLAEHHTWLEVVRLLCYSALWKRDAGLAHTKEAAMVKWLAPQLSVAAAHDAVLLHGNVGYTAEAPFVQRMIDIMAIELADGTAQIQKAIIAREILGPGFRPY